MRSVTTCKAKLNTKLPIAFQKKVDEPAEIDQVLLRFNADYSDESNKAWAKYTPVLDFSMVVLPEVAEGFEVGQNYLVTFEPEIIDTECTCTDEMACSSCVKN